MTDRKLIAVTRQFREGILDGETSENNCAMVSWALQDYLIAVCGVEYSCREVDLGYINHVFLELPDGRVLDATADQFEGFPDVYLGEPAWIHKNKNTAQAVAS